MKEPFGDSNHSDSRGTKCKKQELQPIEGKQKESSRLSCLEPLSHARSHFSVLRVSLKGLRKESFSACTVGYKITSFL